jgi:hypothetical protein
MALAVGMILFQIINKNIVDVVSQYSGRYVAESLRFGISALLISAPVFYFTANKIYKNLFSGNLKKDSAIRKWLSYLILLISSVVMTVWLMITVNSFLNGELTSKFILKALAAFSISAIVFSFYFYDIRREKVEGEKSKIMKIYFYASLLIVLAAFIVGILSIDSPREVRKQKIDQTLLNNISFVSREISNYYNNTNKLPENLDNLKEHNLLSGVNFYDPETKEKIEYKIISATEYELCTNFRASNEEYNQFKDREFYDEIKHGSGYICIKKNVYLWKNLK